MSVEVVPEDDGERWTRNFDGKIFSSFQSPGTKKNEHLLVEEFGIFDVALAVVFEDERLYLVPRRWSCFGIPLPHFLLPTGQSFETELDGAFCFHVEISAPMIGLIVAYTGTLALE